jgi:PKD repeat protein
MSDYITVNFTGTPLYGIVPVTVMFTDLTILSPTSWEWNFGDGSPHSTEKNPVHIYEEPGLYTVTLTAGKDLIFVSETKIDFIKIYDAFVGEIQQPGGGFTRFKGPSLIFD